MHIASSSAVEAALEGANFCTAWNCEETQFTQICECNEYVTRDTCDNNERRLKTTKKKKGTSSGTPSSCRSYKECVAYSCRYIETPFYTACNCNLGGEERLEDDFYGISESSHCQGWMCFQGEERSKYDDYAYNDSWDYDFYASRVHTISTNAFNTSGHYTETKWVIVVDNELHYSCSKSDESGLWCAAWRGASPHHGDYVEQLCECHKGTTAASLTGGFCEKWSCTSYYMFQCNAFVEGHTYSSQEQGCAEWTIDSGTTQAGGHTLACYNNGGAIRIQCSSPNDELRF